MAHFPEKTKPEESSTILNKNLDLVQRLTREAFGFGVKPNWHGFGVIEGEVYYQQRDGLGLIARIPRGISRFFYHRTFYGLFTKPDGSALEVLKLYQPQATNYAQAYSRETGKKVVIDLMEDNYLF